ncbi:MAG TPA: septal ring lytic transglycosylase RlpA family protein [Terriglobales bacterium]|nr:septal ring lytic transglycosylase RlpA family protein [Terriglobales bacterium]
MRGRLAHGLASVLLVASLGAAQGPTSSGSKEIRGLVAHNPIAAYKPVSQNKPKQAAPYQVGTASWYGEYFEGRTTASGEPYNMYDLTAAHPTLPLGTWVRVTNLRNGRRVYVRINDRGPIVPGRIIDLSYTAAEALHFKNKGIQRVRLDIVSANEGQPQEIALLHPVAY